MPLLLAPFNGVEDVLADGVNGFIVERDGLSIAGKAGLILENASLGERFGAAAIARANDFTWDAMADRLETDVGLWLAAGGRDQRAGKQTLGSSKKVIS